ncbi:MAG: hypothetical protein H0T91_00005 [Propionibacteriaceae bacterium]|nr:hypothetical protein [Propionibacteriaceae bacterium]
MATTSVSPPDLPESLTKATLEITTRADPPALRAAKIQRYLRSSDFTYSTEPLPGSGYKALENFLLKDQKGYCEQFATAMAMMARVVGIPSRVAVGFLPGERKGDHWEVTIRDMHAWPELFFAGFGWVRFEPTPASVTGTAPAWTVPNSDRPSGSASDDPTNQPSAAEPTPSAQPSAAPSEQPTGTTADPGFPLARTLLGTGIGLVALLILAAPATIRVRRRGARLTASEAPAEERVEAAWEEIRDTVLDYGGSWPSGSPRAIGGEIGNRLGGTESATMTQVATLVERSRYARTFTDEAAARDLPVMAHQILRGIAQPQSRLRKMRAVVVPRSLFRRGR